MEFRSCIVFGGPSAERNISAGSIKPWVTYLGNEPGTTLTVVFYDREETPYLLPSEFGFTNTCEDFEELLGDDNKLESDELDRLFSGQDVVIPLVHGTFGEDGRLQARLEKIGVEYLFSRPGPLDATYDKAKTYRALESGGFPVPRHFVISASDWADDARGIFERARALNTGASAAVLCAVKPLRSGSSLGVSLPPDDFTAFQAGVEAAFEFDEEVLVEELLVGTEFSVLVVDGCDGSPWALAPTEIEHGRKSGEDLVPRVYSTRDKYLHGEGAKLHTPFRSSALQEIRDAAAGAYGVLGMRHLSRIDGFVVDGVVYVTDVNGISGTGFSSFVFLQTSMVGLSHRDLIGYLIEKACGRNPFSLSDESRGKRVRVVMGGGTSERQVSRQSGVFVGLCLMARGYNVSFCLLDRQHRFTEIGLFLALHHDVAEIEELVADVEGRERIRHLAGDIAPGLGGGDTFDVDRHRSVGRTVDLATAVEDADFVFLALHGGIGEDGTIQAALDVLGKPYNGCGPRASRLCADKYDLSRLIDEAGIEGVSIPRHAVYTRDEMLDQYARLQSDADAVFGEWCDRLEARALVCKPRADGCSSGVKLLRTGDELAQFVTGVITLRESFPTGWFHEGSREIKLPNPMPRDWVLEQALVDEDGSSEAGSAEPGSKAWFEGRRFVELTVGVVEVDGELVSGAPTIALAEGAELSLEEKFQQGVGTNLFLSAFVDDTRVAWVENRVVAIAHAAGLEGYSRIDVFLDRVEDQILVIEVNTLCGLTEATVFYTQMFAAFDWNPAETLERIVEAALD